MSRCPRLHHRLLAATVIAFGCLVPAAASAAPLLVLGQDGRARWRDDPFLRGPADTPIPDVGQLRHTPKRAGVARSRGRTASSALRRLLRTHQITPGDYARYQASLRSALAAVRRMSGTRAAELQAVIDNLHSIAADGMLTPSRLPALFLTLDRNRSWWTTGPLLAPGQRVSFQNSQLVWEYYPGQGIELQELGSFGQADWMYQAGPQYFGRLRALVDELIPLAAHRGGGLAWEYYFQFDGGRPPWTSAMSQGTAIQALTQTSEAFHDPAYMDLARQALPIFTQGPPLGVAQPTALGRRYLLYSFAPNAAVINAFLQSLIGLYDYAKASDDPQGLRLFQMGDAEARAELPSYDTGAWSLYQPGEESSLNYHRLVIEFLQQLCSRTGTPVYCTTANRFQSYLKTPPVLKLLTTRLPARTSASVWFQVSKISRVGITIKRGGDTLFLTSAEFSHGAHSFSVPALRHGRVTIELDATDLAGNYSQTSANAQVGRRSAAG